MQRYDIADGLQRLLVMQQMTNLFWRRKQQAEQKKELLFVPIYIIMWN